MEELDWIEPYPTSTRGDRGVQRIVNVSSETVYADIEGVVQEDASLVPVTPREYEHRAGGGELLRPGSPSTRGSWPLQLRVRLGPAAEPYIRELVLAGFGGRNQRAVDRHVADQCWEASQFTDGKGVNMVAVCLQAKNRAGARCFGAAAWSRMRSR